MTVAMILFWVGTVCLLVAFGCSIAMNFVKKEKVYKILNWITAGTICVSFCCYVIYEVLIGK